MKQWILCVAALAIMAGPVFAAGNSLPSGASPDRGNGMLGGPRHHERDYDEHPTAPVPEPGTMALASMGLIALGAAARRRRAQ